MRTCRKILLVAFALLAARSFGGIGATEAWVANYVSNFVSKSASPRQWQKDGTNYITNGGITLSFEPATEYALKVAEDTAASRALGITNNLIFARLDGSNFVHRPFLVGLDADGLYLSNGSSRWQGMLYGVQTWIVDAATNRICRLAYTYIQPEVEAGILKEGR